MSDNKSINKSRLSDQERDRLGAECDKHKWNKKVGFGTSYTSRRACEVSSLYGIEGGNHVSTLVSDSGKPISYYVMGRETIVHTK